MSGAAQKKLHDVGRTAAELQADDALEQKIVERENSVRLTREQAEHILELIENPPQPNAAMRDAIALHRKMIRA